ncbi:hypothetical protein FAI40_08360 [Acetobacteraceae bacterium]|nr:hypothetical protein FAI40_08360 [Acetobacteraceae bacterium]
MKSFGSISGIDKPKNSLQRQSLNPEKEIFMTTSRSKRSFPLLEIGTFALLLGVFTLAPNLVHAATMGGTQMPYETSIQTIQRSLTGPVAHAIMVIGIAVGLYPYIHGGSDMNGFVRHMMTFCLVGGILLFADTVVTKLSPGGAMIPVSMAQIDIANQNQAPTGLYSTEKALFPLTSQALS